MKYIEEVKDLFTVSSDYYLAHCVSADFALGAGIAKEFNARYGMRQLLKEHYPNYCREWYEQEKDGDCLLEGRVFNLVTKMKYNHKPLYDDVHNALEKMRDICIEKGISKVAMPLIGCGLDALNWEWVSLDIRDIFCDTDIEVLVCKLA